jgi:RHS repeat-associated protein
MLIGQTNILGLVCVLCIGSSAQILRDSSPTVAPQPWQGSYKIDSSLSLNTFGRTQPLLLASDDASSRETTFDAPEATPPQQQFSCSCNSTIYDNATECVTDCHVSLACFTGICYPIGTPPPVDCEQQQAGGSSIGCQNQRLGEHVSIVGTGFLLQYESDRVPGRNGASAVAIKDAAMIGGWTLSVHHTYDPAGKTLFLGDGSQRSSWQLGTAVTYNGNTVIPSEDGSEVYVFNASGQHLQTLKPLTGALKYQFAYDPAGNLSSVTDGSGNVTTIQRDGSEHATAIVSPLSQTTVLTLDSSGFLSQVTDPAGHTAKFINTSGGLMTSHTDSNGNISNYAYDGQGNLILDSGPAAGSTTLARTSSSSGYSVTSTTALGRTSTFQVTTGVPGEQLTNTWPNGLQSTTNKTQQNGQLTESSTLPDGTSTSTTMSADPRWGLADPVTANETLTRGTLTTTTSGSRTATLGTPANPFSLTTQTDSQTVNGRTYTSLFTGATKTYVNTSPANRTATTVFDSLERVSSMQLGALLPAVFAYDSRGRLSTITQGTRVTTLAYDPNGFLASVSDPMQLTTSFTHDAAGRLTTKTLPDGRVTAYAYDSNGNLISVTPPGKLAHNFSFTPVNLLSAYTPPAVTGTGSTTSTYNADRNLATVTRPDGQTLAYGYDSAGRLSSVTVPTEVVTYSYDTTTGSRNAASITGGEAIAYADNGSLPISSTWTGTVAGSVSRTYNNNFWVASEGINGANTVNFTYDNDGLLTNAGSLALTLDPTDGLITATALGNATDTRTYDTFGELTGYNATYQASALYNVTFTRDADGRITSKTETIGGKTNSFTYGYDAAGRLTTVTENGAALSAYTYDSNSNRLTATTASGTVSGTYDAQDRLLTYATATYAYTANGELASQSVGSQATTYQYDVLGNLLAATLPNGTKITYLVDAENHRVGKQANGVLQAGFLYDGNRIVAQLDSSNAIVSQFIYASRATAPDYMLNGGVTYRIFTDQLGSPRLVVNTSTGAVTEQIDYDEFGNVINDTNPGFQPFGFAGGLYDQDTKLVRFGARDYNPAIGRWTAKDPILFTGGDTNLYGYALGNPASLTDPDGLATSVTIWQPVGWGESSFGHVSVDIDGITFSFGPGGMSIMLTSDYLSRNAFRDGVAAMLNLTLQQEAALMLCLAKPQGKYSATKNNCGSPVQRCLQNLGINTGNQMLPVSLGNMLLDLGIVSGFQMFPASRPSDGGSAPWAR